jgi:uncharacterized delta-60 repeat protein
MNFGQFSITGAPVSHPQSPYGDLSGTVNVVANGKATIGINDFAGLFDRASITFAQPVTAWGASFQIPAFPSNETLGIVLLRQDDTVLGTFIPPRGNSFWGFATTAAEKVGRIEFRSLDGGLSGPLGDWFTLDDIVAKSAPAPTVVTSPATNLTPIGATLNGTVNPNGSSTTALFEYGPTAGYGLQIPATPVPGSGLTPVAISAAIGGLTCNTQYHFRAVATSPLGTTNGPDQTLTTAACPPATVVTLAAAPVTTTTATLNATVNPNGSSTTALFQYGPTTGYGTQIAATPVPGSGMAPVAVSAAIAGLNCGTVYHFRVVATNSGGTTNGSDLTLTTVACTAGAPTITGITTGNAQLDVAFTAGSDGGAPLTNYRYSTDGGATWTTRSPAATTSPLIITGLTNGQDYQVQIRAMNAGGDGTPSASVTARPSTTPDAPAITGVTPGNTQLAIAFTPGFDGGAPLSNFKYSLDGGATWIVRSPAAITSPLLITGLANGASRLVQLRAVNSNGDGIPSATASATPVPSADETVDAFNPGANGDVLNIAALPNSILVSGGFTMLGGGGTGTVGRNQIGRLTLGGAVDGFDPGINIATGSRVTAMAVQADGKVFVASAPGATAEASSDERRHVGRFNADGSLDTNFTSAANGPVFAVLVQPDGKIVVAGSFTTLGRWVNNKLAEEERRNRIGRFNPDGSIDLTFDPGANGDVRALALQADGRILVGGSFTTLGGGGTGTAARQNIGRLNADGTPDLTFDPGTNGQVRALALQADGRILVGGAFTTLGGGVRANIGRLTADGLLDQTFIPGPAGPAGGGSNPGVDSLLALSNGTILVGGFSVAAPHLDLTLRHLARLAGDGSLDTTFNPRVDGRVNALAIQLDGKILIGGQFGSVGGTVRQRLARLGAARGAMPRFTDDPILSGVTPLRAMHIVELRARVEALRARFGLPAIPWTDPTLTGVAARAVHIQELRDALLGVHDVTVAAGHSVVRPAFTDNPLTARQSGIRALHIEELRAAVMLLEALP